MIVVIGKYFTEEENIKIKNLLENLVKVEKIDLKFVFKTNKKPSFFLPRNKPTEPT